MKANLTQWLKKARKGYLSLQDWYAENPEPFRLEVDNHFTLYFTKANDTETNVSITYDGRRAYEWIHFIDVTLDDLVVPTFGIEELVDQAEQEASLLKKQGKIASYSIGVYHLLRQKAKRVLQ